MTHKYSLAGVAAALILAAAIPTMASEYSPALVEITKAQKAERVDAAQSEKTEETVETEETAEIVESSGKEKSGWDGPVLTASAGVVYGPTGKETYYNLDMSGVVSIMRSMGNTDEYWVREDGVKMLGDYVMVAANLNTFPRGSLVECSLGTAIVCDTGGFAAANPTQLDIAVTW